MPLLFYAVRILSLGGCGSRRAAARATWTRWSLQGRYESKASTMSVCMAMFHVYCVLDRDEPTTAVAVRTCENSITAIFKHWASNCATPRHGRRTPRSTTSTASRMR